MTPQTTPFREAARPLETLTLERWHYDVQLGTLRVVGQLPGADLREHWVTSAVLDCMGEPMGGPPDADQAQLDVLDEGMEVRTESGSTYLLGEPHACLLHARRS